MSQIQHLIARAESYAAREGLSLSTVSRKLLNDGKGLARLKAGGQCTLKTLEQALARLAALEGNGAAAPGGAAGEGRAQPSPAPLDRAAMTHLDRLEAESIHIMREVAAECENPVMLYSIGKDSSVMLHLAMKAFYPSKPPFPLLHVDTTWKFREMIRFRDETAKRLGLDLIVHINQEGLAQGVGPFTHGSQIHTDVMKTQALKQALDKYKFDAAFGGARRDEEKSRAKERVFSFRTAQHRWDPKNQRPELWNIYNTRVRKGESIRVFPLSNWTELDIWQYIWRENIPIVPLYFAAERPVVERDGALIMVDDERMPLANGERPRLERVRFRTLGCYPLTGAVRSAAATLPEIIQEMLLAKTSERQGRVIDHDQAASMEKKKQEGYF
ncbi:MAG: sulfate adenylyltransferase subunit CysD [Amphiplicatus sp.]|jgi:sulfate adenylyltransferase subunit 2